MQRTGCILFLVLVAAACFGQAAPNCSLVGAWYGGSPDTPFPYYMVTVTATSADHYFVVAQYSGELQSAGYLHWTDWKGEVTKKGNSYSGVLFSIYQLDPNHTPMPPGVDPNLPEMDFIFVQRVEQINCNTIRFTYDKWYVYYNFTNEITPLGQAPPWPGSILIMDPPLVEVYHRYVTSTPNLSSPSTNTIRINPEMYLSHRLGRK